VGDVFSHPLDLPLSGVDSPASKEPGISN